MLAVVNTVNPMITLPTPIVASSMADATATVRVAADSVPPSVAVTAVDNNSRGSGSAGPAPVAPATLATTAASPPTLPSTFLISTGAGFWASPQATFLAHMISQDASPQSGSLLGQYEKLIAFASVKYKPSNATMPTPEPAGVFGRIVKQDQAAAQPVAAQLSQPTAAAAATQAQASAPAAVAENVQPTRATNTNPARAARGKEAASTNSSLSLQAMMA